MKKILLVTNEQDLCLDLCPLLQFAGFNVTTSNSINDAIHKVYKYEYDIVVTDYIFSGATALKLITDIRNYSIIPIIVMSISHNSISAAAVLEFGADDFIFKPFCDRELIARINAVIRRSSQPVFKAEKLKTQSFKNEYQSPKHTEDITLDDELEIDLNKQICTYKSNRLALTSTELKLLNTFINNRGKIINKEFLVVEVLGKEISNENRTIDMHISNLRKKLPPRKDGKDRIKTIHKRGYLMLLNNQY